MIIEPASPPRLAFLFNARDSVWGGIAPHLYSGHRLLGESLALSEIVIKQLLGWSLREELTCCVDDETLNARQNLLEPALTAMQIALTDLWRAHGVLPDATGGCSCGEFAAGYARGELSRENALELACRISREFHLNRQPSRVVAVGWSVREVEPLQASAPASFYIAADGWSDVTVIACTNAALDPVIRYLIDRGAPCRVLPVPIGVHTTLADFMEDEFTRPFSSPTPSPASTIPGYAFTGVRASAPPNPRHWWDAINLRLQVRRNIGAMVADGYSVFVEIGGRLSFTTAVREAALEHERRIITLPTMLADHAVDVVMNDSLHQLSAMGLVRQA